MKISTIHYITFTFIVQSPVFIESSSFAGPPAPASRLDVHLSTGPLGPSAVDQSNMPERPISAASRSGSRDPWINNAQRRGNIWHISWENTWKWGEVWKESQVIEHIFDISHKFHLDGEGMYRYDGDQTNWTIAETRVNTVMYSEPWRGVRLQWPICLTTSRFELLVIDGSQGTAPSRQPDPYLHNLA